MMRAKNLISICFIASLYIFLPSITFIRVIIMQSTSVASKGQITIPKHIRQQLGIRKGSKLEAAIVGNHIEKLISLDGMVSLESFNTNQSDLRPVTSEPSVPV
ncbi:AbrB/MazE/SpoVT family DNA-binding domain-containing protein [Methyloprofundus sp.]|uniref:AbrB/MazE/SpoVT family DNA-binding domain-containing protein n=2 Tax=Methyloprofundus sp. TaxID=2020875 RepID=UPI003D10DA5B